MSTPEGGSRAPYIIICNGRIDLAAAKNGTEAIQAASSAAMRLTSYYGDKVSRADTYAISKLQHEMMELLTGNAPAGTHANGFRSASEMADEMFAQLDKLEKQHEG